MPYLTSEEAIFVAIVGILAGAIVMMFNKLSKQRTNWLANTAWITAVVVTMLSVPAATIWYIQEHQPIPDYRSGLAQGYCKVGTAGRLSFDRRELKIYMDDALRQTVQKLTQDRAVTCTITWTVAGSLETNGVHHALAEFRGKSDTEGTILIDFTNEQRDPYLVWRADVR